MNANKESLYKHVDFLTSLRPFRNYANLRSLEEVVRYLSNEFHAYGLNPIEQKFTVKETHMRGTEYKNVIATYNPQHQKRLIVGAHYDVCGNQPGADDNASAVAGLLESARMVAEAKPNIDYRIDFVAYCLEEPPFYQTKEMGSFIHAESVSGIRKDIIGLINFEMIGYFHEGPQEYPHPALAQIYPEKANFIAVVGKHQYHDFNQKVYDLMRIDAGIDVQMVDHPLVESLAGMSDQLSYWKFNIPALMITDTATERNPNYHKMGDDIGSLNFDKMKEVVSCTYKAIVGL